MSGLVLKLAPHERLLINLRGDREWRPPVPSGDPVAECKYPA